MTVLDVLAFVVLVALLIGYLVWDHFQGLKEERERAEQDMRMWQAFNRAFNKEEE